MSERFAAAQVLLKYRNREVFPMGEDGGDERGWPGVKSWSDRLATLVADSLMEARLIGRDDLDRAAFVIAEEVFARLCLGDFPPAGETGASRPDA